MAVEDLLKVDEVVTISGNRIHDCNPDPSGKASYHGSNGQQSVLISWNSGAYASDWGAKGALVCRGGGDGDYWGNETYVFDLETLLWKRISEPSEVEPVGVNVTNKVECEHADGRPGAPHTYDATCYLTAVESGKERGCLLMAKSTFVKTANSTGRSHFIDLATGADGRWSTNYAIYGSNHLPTTCKDTKRGRIWMAYRGSPSGLHYLDLSTRSWVKAVSDHPGTLTGYPVSEYLIKQDVMLSVCGGRFALINLASPSTPKKFAIVQGAPAWSENRMGLAYVPELGDHGVIFLREGSAANAQKLWRVDIPANIYTDPWIVQEIVMRGVSVSGENQAGIYKRLRWAPKIGALIWCSIFTGPVYAYKISSAPPQDVIIQTPQSLSLTSV